MLGYSCLVWMYVAESADEKSNTWQSGGAQVTPRGQMVNKPIATFVLTFIYIHFVTIFLLIYFLFYIDCKRKNALLIKVRQRIMVRENTRGINKQ